MGEISKISGDHGEDVVSKFFKEVIGHDNMESNIKVDCIYETKHIVGDAEKRVSHGIDALVSGVNSLKDNNLEVGIVSVKHTIDKYPTLKTFEDKFSSYFRELVYTINCFKKSPKAIAINKSPLAEGSKSTDYVGIIFWISNKDKNDTEWNIKDKIKKSLLNVDNEVYDKILIVDNDTLEFLYENILQVKKDYDIVDFFYPQTGFNQSSKTSSFGKKMPLIYLNSNIIPLRIEHQNEIFLYFLIKDEFSRDSYISLINLAKNINQIQATQKTVISFPNYNKLEHGSIIEEINNLNIIDRQFLGQVKVIKHKIDFRNNE
ncbi:GapS4a family protein [Myroides sp.]|uniref:GapS4a family protein n=1 Tax=Myroides sp. TaxID=1874736 RepID=UPI003F37A3FC